MSDEMDNYEHKLIKEEVENVVEAAAVALINANASGDDIAYKKQLQHAISEIHQLYMQTFIVEQTKMVS